MKRKCDRCEREATVHEVVIRNGKQVEKLVSKKLSCGDCPMPCKGIVKVKERGLSDVRRPDYETLVGFGANLMNEDLALVTACHDACNRYGIDAVSSSGDAAE